jgi:glucose-6-phosphate 1-dehydrogenase
MENIPTTIVIFGASGDLTSRKLIPALYNNFKKWRLPERVNVVGFARRPYTDDSFRAILREGVIKFSAESYDSTIWLKFAEMVHYFQGNLDVKEDFPKLESFLQLMENGPSNRLYYLATAPEHYSIVASELGAAGMAKQGMDPVVWRRIIIEKPFGRDLGSAQELNRAVHAVFEESQVYRIDHYLGKETAQNILFFRFANTIFEPVWNRRYVNNVQVTVSETVDVAHRAGYYDTAGVMRDMFQNHLLQLLSLVAMEAPSSFSADAVRNEKAKVFESIRPVALNDTVRGQYAGYRETDGVAPNSQTPTFAAIKLNIDNWRWQGVPFYLRSGKALARKTSEIIIEFERPPHLMFHLPEGSDFSPNILSMCIQPDEGIHLRFEAKLPDSAQEMRSVDMDFHYGSSFSGSLPEAYERLLLEAMDGDASLFTRSDGIEASWNMVDPIIQGWEAHNDPPLHNYPVGSWGPEDADHLLARDGRRWRLGCTDEKDVTPTEN